MALQYKIRLATRNPNFTLKDRNRPLFFDKFVHEAKVAANPQHTIKETIQELKQKWVEIHFANSNPITSAAWKEPTLLTASFQYPIAQGETIEEAKQKAYLEIDLDGFKRYFFITSAVVLNEKTIKYTAELDVITTYFDTFDFGRDTKVERRHWDRYIGVKDGKLIRDFSFDSALQNTETELNFNKIITGVDNPFISDGTPYSAIRQTYEDEQKFNNLAAGINKTMDGLYVYAIFKGDNDDVAAWSNKFGGVPTPFILVPLKYDDTNVGSINGVALQRGNAYNVKEVFSSPKLISIIALRNPLSLSTEHFNFKPVENDSITATAWPMISVGNPWFVDFKTIIDDGAIELPQLDAASNPLYETKLFTSQFKSRKLISAKGQEKEIAAEFLFRKNEKGLWGTFQITQTLSPTSADIVVFPSYNDDKDLNQYDKIARTNANRFVFANYDPYPTLSSPYLDFVNGHLNAFKSGLEANAVKTGLGILGAGVAGASSPAKAPLAIGAAIGTAVNGYYKEKQMRAEVADVKNQTGQVAGLSNSSIIDNIFSSRAGTEWIDNWNFGIKLQIEELIDIHKKEAYSYLSKFGYRSDLIENIADYSYFQKRSLYSYFEMPMISHAIEKAKYGNQIIDAINARFNDGIRFWSVDANGNVKINDYSKENWGLNVKEILLNPPANPAPAAIVSKPRAKRKKIVKKAKRK